MKKVFSVLVGFFAIALQAQEFESADDALVYLDEHFSAATVHKEGAVWADPYMLQFEKDDAIYFHAYKGTVLADDFVKGNLEGLEQVQHSNYADQMVWDDIKGVSLNKQGSDYLITLTGPITGEGDAIMAGFITLYVYEAAEAVKIKTALEYVIAHVGE